MNTPENALYKELTWVRHGKELHAELAPAYHMAALLIVPIGRQERLDMQTYKVTQTAGRARYMLYIAHIDGEYEARSTAGTIAEAKQDAQDELFLWINSLTT